MATLAVTAAVGCGPPKEEAADSSRPSNGLVPEPSRYVRAYADCLRGKGAAVHDVIGIYVVVATVDDAVRKADEKCKEDRAEVLRSLEDGRRVEDNDGNRLWYFVRGCMERAIAQHPRVADDILVVEDRDAQWTRDFYVCVGVARAYPGPTPPEGVVWPSYPPRQTPSSAGAK
ncbi:MAG: hypothetical protein HOQ43_18035 [Glycomyces artemisiae]|uniref:Uncharacterized protein n=1 Tax=Glycomyces artemisiae TaxID=1076443 RepID=A0A850CEI8_9ACTN|nr:hypothetical protein [Glycomyces artemisiae]NUR31425.1 hypothetical protein [Catenulispora sp.]